MNLVEDFTHVIKEFKYVESFSTFLTWIDIMPLYIKIFFLIGLFGLIGVSYMFIKYTMPDYG